MTVPMIKSIGDVPYPIDTHSDAFSPLLTAGAALGITGDGPTESAAWLQRTSTSDGPTTAKSIHGRTLRWNQLAPAPDSELWTATGITSSVSGSAVTLAATSTAATYRRFRSSAGGCVVGHKHLIAFYADTTNLASGHTATVGMYESYGTGTNRGGIVLQAGVARTHYAQIITPTTGTNLTPTVAISSTALSPESATFEDVQCIDLTAMFGAGSEPSTIEEFEALYGDPYYPYDAGSLLPVNMTGIETEDADGNPLQTRTIPAGILRSAGTVYDELTETERITRIGERAYQSGDESDPTVVTDGTVTHYALATPTVTTIDPPLNLTYRTEHGGTERVMVPTGELSAPPTLVTAQGYTAESLRDAALATIAPVENGTASTNYAVGGYLIHGGQLCKVTTAIATGESISIGTNVVTTTVMAEVIALIAQ